MNTTYLEPNDPTTAVMRKAYPAYNGRQFKMNIHAAPGMNLNSYWSGGSRDYYRVIELATGRLLEVPQNGTVFDNASFDNAAMPAPGYAVVEHTIFSGHDLGLTLHLHQENAAAYLPAAVEMTADEMIVLYMTRTTRSSYAGKSRAEMARDEYKITLARWDEARAALTARGLLTKVGALTTAGKNAAGSLTDHVEMIDGRMVHTVKTR